MTTLYALSWEPGTTVPGKSQAFFTSETKARKQGPVFAQQHGVEVVLERYEIADKRDLPWLCALMGTHDPESGQPYEKGVALEEPKELSRWKP